MEERLSSVEKGQGSVVQPQQDSHCSSCEEHKMDMEQTNFQNSFVVLIAKLTIAVVIRFWRACTAGLLILLLFYWLYGSLVALTLMLLAILGKRQNY